MLPIWIICTVIAGLSSVIFNYINRNVLKDNDDSNSYAWWFEFFRTIIFLPFFIFFFDIHIDLASIALFIVIGLSEFFSVYFYMKMHSFSELSISTIVSQLRLAWVPFLAFLFLHENLLPIEYIGIVLIIFGQIVVISPKKIVFDHGIKFAFFSSLFVAINSIIQKYAVGIFSAQEITVAMGVPALIGFPILMKNSKNRIQKFGSEKWKKILLATIFNSICMLLLVWALKFGPVSKVVALFQSLMVIQVLVGIFILNEKKDSLKKMLGCSVVILGMLLLVIF